MYAVIRSYVRSDTIICTCLLKNVLSFNLLVMDDPLATVIQVVVNISYVCLTEYVNGFLVCNVGTFIFKVQVMSGSHSMVQLTRTTVL